LTARPIEYSVDYVHQSHVGLHMALGRSASARRAMRGSCKMRPTRRGS